MAVGQSDAPNTTDVRPSEKENGPKENGQPELTVTAEGDVWDEQKIEESLKTLKEMYIQVSPCRVVALLQEQYQLLKLHTVARTTQHNSSSHRSTYDKTTIPYVPILC